MGGGGGAHERGQVGAAGGGLGQAGGQLWPVAVCADAGVDRVDELLEAAGVRVLGAKRRLGVVFEHGLDGVGAHGVLRGAEQAGVVVGDVVGGAEDGDFGGQLGVGGQDWLGPDGGGGRCPVVDDGVADLVGQLGDQIGAGGQVGAPLRVVGEQGRGGRQPAQRPDPAGVRAGGVDAPVDDGGGVVGAEQLVLGGGGR